MWRKLACKAKAHNDYHVNQNCSWLWSINLSNVAFWESSLKGMLRDSWTTLGSLLTCAHIFDAPGFFNFMQFPGMVYKTGKDPLLDWARVLFIMIVYSKHQKLWVFNWYFTLKGGEVSEAKTKLINTISKMVSEKSSVLHWRTCTVQAQPTPLFPSHIAPNLITCSGQTN